MLGEIFYRECDLYWLSFDCGNAREGKLLFQNYQNAAMRFRAAAELGHREAQYQLATMYQTGRGVPQDFAEAAKWYRAVAEAGSREARGPLGKLYLQMGDYVSAHMWFNLAAAVNDPWASKSRDDVAGAALLQRPQDDDLWRLVGSAARHHGQGDAGAVVPQALTLTAVPMASP